MQQGTRLKLLRTWAGVSTTLDRQCVLGDHDAPVLRPVFDDAGYDALRAAAIVCEADA